MSCGKVILFALYYQFSDDSALLYIQVMKTDLVLYLYLISHFPAFNLSVSSSCFNLSKDNKSIKDTIEAVSYTHLDVYKRQVCIPFDIAGFTDYKIIRIQLPICSQIQDFLYRLLDDSLIKENGAGHRQGLIPCFITCLLYTSKIIYGDVPSTELMPQRKTAALTAV